MATPLVSVAEYSNVVSVLTVLLAFFVMVIFILRLHEDNGISTIHTPGSDIIPAIPMVMVQNPFAFSLNSPGSCSYKDLYFEVSSQVPFLLQIFWRVSIQELHQTLYIQWSSFQEKFLSNQLLSNSDIITGELQILPECINKACHVTAPKNITEDDLGQMPRTKYPAVIFLVRQDTPEDSNIQTVGAMINIVHIKDSICTVDSCVLLQYLKQTNGFVSPLKPLYMTKEDRDVSSTETTNNESPITETEYSQTAYCVVCQCNPLTRVLLPCRHACICRGCFAKINKCPMCRSNINSYFCIQEEEEEETVIEEPFLNWADLNWRQRFEYYIMRLNNYLGFT